MAVHFKVDEATIYEQLQVARGCHRAGHQIGGANYPVNADQLAIDPGANHVIEGG